MENRNKNRGHASKSAKEALRCRIEGMHDSILMSWLRSSQSDFIKRADREMLKVGAGISERDRRIVRAYFEGEWPDAPEDLECEEKRRLDFDSVISRRCGYSVGFDDACFYLLSMISEGAGIGELADHLAGIYLGSGFPCSFWELREKDPEHNYGSDSRFRREMLDKALIIETKRREENFCRDLTAL